MTVEILNNNLTILKTLHPNAYGIIENSKPNQRYKITLSKSELPTLTYIKPDESAIYLISKYDPLREAERLIDSLNFDVATNFLVWGIGLGYHIEALLNSIPNNSKVFVIEMDKNLARLAFETKDFSNVLNYPNLTLVFPDNHKEITLFLENEKINLCLNGYRHIQQNSLTDVNPGGYKRALTEINNYFQAAKVDFQTQFAKSKTFYNNIFQNHQNLIGSPGVNLLKDSFSNLPAIICSAGPSLDKNIQFLKAKRENYLLISVATALKPLLENNISPDFVIAIDPNEVTTQFFDLETELENTWLIYDPVIPAVIPEFFAGKRLAYDSPIVLAKWLQKQIGEKGSLGNVFSVAHAAYQFAKLAGCSPIAFVGQDFSFSKKRLHSRHSYYYQYREDWIDRIKTIEHLDDLKFQKYSKNTLQRKDIFDRHLVTTISMETYSEMFSKSIGENSRVFNATEGGIGIRDIDNVLLKETINFYCTSNVSKKKITTLNAIPTKNCQGSQVAESAKRLLVVFKEILNHVKRLESKFLQESMVATQQIKGYFIEEMKNTISELLKNSEAVLLLQGYDFSGFSAWNQKSNDIMRRRSTTNPNELISEEFQRDKEFLFVLKRSVEFNIHVFEGFSNLKTTAKPSPPQ